MNPLETDTRSLAVFYQAILQGMSAQARDGATRTDLRRIATQALDAWPAPASLPATTGTVLSEVNA